MVDQTPDERADERPGASPRRSGLERLRAARGTGDAAPPASTGGGAADRGAATPPPETSSRTAVLDTGDDADSADAPPQSSWTTAPSATESATTEPAAGGSTKAARRRRQRERKSAGVGAAASGTRGRFTRRATGAGAVDPAGPPTSRQALAAVLLALLAIGLLVPALLNRDAFVGKTKQEKAVDALVAKRDDALGFARRFTVTFFSPDYKTIDGYNDQVAAMTTGDFNKDFVSKRGDLKSLLTKVQSQATGRVLAAGVSKVSGPAVEVLVVADQTVKTNVTQGRTVNNRYRVRVSLQQTDKGWLVTNFEPVT